MKKKIIAILLASLLCLQLLGCEAGYQEIDYSGREINMYEGENAIENLTLSFLSGAEMGSLNPMHTSSNPDIRIIAELYDGLVISGESGMALPGVATSWEPSDEGKTWTFHLRDNCYWVNAKGERMATVTSEDFLWGLEWVLNLHKNGAVSTQMSTDHVAGAADYLNYTSSLTEEEALALPLSVFLDIVGISAPDPYTVVFRCTKPCPYFPSVVSSQEFLPVSGEHLKELGRDRFLINSCKDAWYNGPYLLTEFIAENEKILDANPEWYGNDEHTRFLSITYKAVENASIAYQLYQNGEVDYVELYQDQLQSIISNPENPYANQLVLSSPKENLFLNMFNFRKKTEDGNEDTDWNRAIACEAFRLAWYFGADISPYLSIINPLDPLICENTHILPRGIAALSDGTDYADLVEEGLSSGDGKGKMTHLNRDLFLKYKEEATEELSAQGVTFPIQVDYPILASDQASLDKALVYKDCVESSLGKDFVNLNFITYVSSYNREILFPRLQSFRVSSWGADYADPSSILFQYLYQNPDAYYTANYMNINDYTEEELNGDYSYMKELVGQFETYNELYEKADAITNDNDARYRAFAEAEIYALQHCLMMPVYVERGWTLSKIDLSSQCSGASGMGRYRHLDIRTDKNGYDNSIWEED